MHTARSIADGLFPGIRQIVVIGIRILQVEQAVAIAIGNSLDGVAPTITVIVPGKNPDPSKIKVRAGAAGRVNAQAGHGFPRPIGMRGAIEIQRLPVSAAGIACGNHPGATVVIRTGTAPEQLHISGSAALVAEQNATGGTT